MRGRGRGRCGLLPRGCRCSWYWLSFRGQGFQQLRVREHSQLLVAELLHGQGDRTREASIVGHRRAPGRSLLSLRHSTLCHELVDGLVSGSGIAFVHLLALAVVRAFSLAGPHKADVLVTLFGYGGVVTFHHGRDRALAAGPKATQDSEVSVGVEHGGGTRAGPGVTVWVPGRGVVRLTAS